MIDEIFDELVLGREDVLGHGFDPAAGQAVMPGRAVGAQRVPARGAPAFRNPALFQNHMADAKIAQMLAQRDPRLARADDDRIYLFHCLSRPFVGARAPDYWRRRGRIFAKPLPNTESASGPVAQNFTVK
jgi:hypothetical protein